jgi:CubicO group peptidase (beta-lactamase class C family)
MHVGRFAPEEVTSRNTEGETDPQDVGLTPADVEAIWDSVVRLYRTGLQPAMSLCIRRRGKIVIERAIGHLRGNAPEDGPSAPKLPIRYDSLFNLFSASKAVTAMMVHMLDERRLVHLDDTVADYIPEFACHGKDSITLRQVLTHRAGIPTVKGTQLDRELLGNYEKIMAVLCNARPLSVPGRRLAYHALTGGYVLGEVVKRVTGRDIRQYLHDEVLAPLGFSTFNFGIERARVNEVAVNAFTGIPAMPPQSWFLKRALGLSVYDAVQLSNEETFLTGIVPSGNIVGTAEEASRFFQMLLEGGRLGETRIFEPRTVRRAVAEQSYLEVDSFLGMPVRYGMGFMLGGETFSPYGGDTPYAFGHLGFTNVLAWADPERAISVGLMTSGKPFITPGQIMWLNVARTVAKRIPKDAR